MIRSTAPASWIFDEIASQLHDNSCVTNQRLGLRVAGAIFALFSVAHVVRLAAHIEINIAGRLISMWPSIIAAIVGAALAIWLLRLAGERLQP